MRPVALVLATLVPLISFAAAPSDPLKDAPPTYREALIAAMRSFTERDFEKAREQVKKADSSWQQTPVSLNILGAIEIEQKNFEAGRKLCLEALQRDPRFFPARFNLAEIPFVQGKYTEARVLFLKLQEDEPDDDLLKFRIFLTYLLEKNDIEAKQHLDRIPLVNDSPISFYANAAWEFSHGQEAKAKDWLASGARTFPPIKHINFVEVFYDLGWLTRAAKQDVAGEAPKQD